MRCSRVSLVLAGIVQQVTQSAMMLADSLCHVYVMSTLLFASFHLSEQLMHLSLPGIVYHALFTKLFDADYT